MSVSINDLQFSVRTRNALLNYGVTTFEKLASMSDEELLSVTYLGRRSWQEIRMKVPAPGEGRYEVLLRQTMNKLCDILIAMQRARSPEVTAHTYIGPSPAELDLERCRAVVREIADGESNVGRS